MATRTRKANTPQTPEVVEDSAPEAVVENVAVEGAQEPVEAADSAPEEQVVDLCANHPERLATFKSDGLLFTAVALCDECVPAAWR